MNHGGRRHTMAAMVPHPWLRGTETSANMSYNKAASLKLEFIIFIGTYKLEFIIFIGTY
jgi:hypothetical protein